MCMTPYWESVDYDRLGICCYLIALDTTDPILTIQKWYMVVAEKRVKGFNPFTVKREQP